MEAKRFYIHTLGCKVNQYESQAMREALVAAGFKECLSKQVADIYILNTCTVTAKADRESRYLIGLYHRTNPKAKIVVTGCYVEMDADQLSMLPGISHIIPNHNKARIAGILSDANGRLSSERRLVRRTSARPFGRDRILSLSKDKRTNDEVRISDFKDHSKAFVKIQDGCDNFCAYCKVPLVRGVLVSRPMNEITEEVERLVAKGFCEIILAGICLGAWGRDLPSSVIAGNLGMASVSLVDALKLLDKIRGDFRIRLSSIEPKYVNDELVELIAGNRRICRHLHIPMQSGDDEILRRMNRPYTASRHKELVEKIRKRVRDVAITTDMMVGFPGETDERFRNTLSFMKEIIPARTHIFTYSRRKGTSAYDMGMPQTREVLRKRYYELNTIALGASYLFRKDFLGRTLDVLAETKRDKLSRCLTGYSDNYIKVLFDGGDELAKKIVPVRIDEMNLMDTFGTYEQ